MEEKLAAYRLKKEKEREKENTVLNRFKGYFNQPSTKDDTNTKPSLSSQPDEGEKVLPNVNQITERKVKSNNSEYSSSHCENPNNDDSSEREETSRSTSDKWWKTLLVLKILLWLCGWGFFIELEFGAVYFTVSLMFFMFLNTRTGKKDSSKPSAYSVFNKDYETIQGTVTAEQLQRNMFRIPGTST